jgi:Ca-activated chloride channel family protein
MPESFHFQQPEWFWVLIPVLIILWLLQQAGGQSSAWRKVCDARLLPYLLDKPADSRFYLPLWLLAIGGLLAVIALADPVWEQQQQPVFRNEAARVIVLDLSNSMLSPDLKPSRLIRARYKVADILQRNLDGQTGLVVFAGDAFTVSPLTHDVDTIQALLSPLEPALMPAQGSRVDLGLLQAANLMQQAGIQQGNILLITDGFDGQRALDAAQQVSQNGYPVSVLGVGTDTGAPIPTGRGGFLRDQQGEIVVPALEQAALRKLAATGGGSFTAISSSDHDIDYLLSRMSSQSGEGAQESGMSTTVWQSNGPWLAVLLLPLAALAFRRGWLLMLVMVVGGTVSAPQPAMALGWDDLWLRADQQAARALQAGEPEQAAQLAHDPALRGTAEYKAGNFDAALDAFATQGDVDAEYNQGNALAQLQRYKDAIAAYDRALEQQPEMADALHNRAEVEKLLQQQEQEQQQEQQDQQQDDETGEQGEQEDSEAEQQDASSAEEQQAGADEESQEDSQQSAEAEEEESEGEQAAEAEPLDSEEQRAAEQWLRRIPDDPGGLLRRKFLYQYKQRAGRSTSEQQAW